MYVLLFSGNAEFGFSLTVRQEAQIRREQIIQALNAVKIDVRSIVLGKFLVNDVIKYLNHRVVGEHVNSQTIHDNGFFVGNQHLDIRDKIDYLYTVLKPVS